MSQLAPIKKTEYTILILSGPNKGEVFQILSPHISIGRSSENDIAINNDPRISRHHATINIDRSGIIVKSMNKENLVAVDGKKGAVLALKNNSKITVGNTQLQLQITTLVKDGETAMVKKQGAHAPGPSHVDKDLKSTAKAPPQEGVNFKLIAIGALGLLILFLLTDSGEQTTEKVDIRTEEQIDQDIETYQKLREAEQKIKTQKGTNTREFKTAQALYIKGFRDFKKGQFERAISSFDACMSIFPKHVLCTTYKKLAEMKFQELVQYHMILGRKHVETGQYLACKSSFRNVMIMVRNKGSKIYKEADGQYRLCRARLEGRY